MKELESKSPEDFDRLKILAKEWPFMKYLLIQIESNLLRSDTAIMEDFADLVQDENAKKNLMELILSDYHTCFSKIEVIMGESVEKRRTSKLLDNRLRNNALALLHEIQIDYLKTWRSIRDNESKESNQYLLQLLLLVNALSGGLKGTG